MTIFLSFVVDTNKLILRVKISADIYGSMRGHNSMVIRNKINELEDAKDTLFAPIGSHLIYDRFKRFERRNYI
jgi:hypothetical protein